MSAGEVFQQKPNMDIRCERTLATFDEARRVAGRTSPELPELHKRPRNYI